MDDAIWEDMNRAIDKTDSMTIEDPDLQERSINAEIALGKLDKNHFGKIY